MGGRSVLFKIPEALFIGILEMIWLFVLFISIYIIRYYNTI